uniref:Uncharacterized protein n=1 Tax=Arundo donax TaxID=35708 RepID=A0A0A8YSA2_ARUDO
MSNQSIALYTQAVHKLYMYREEDTSVTKHCNYLQKQIRMVLEINRNSTIYDRFYNSLNKLHPDLRMPCLCDEPTSIGETPRMCHADQIQVLHDRMKSDSRT